MVVLFDLEGTLVNTDSIAQYRKHNWSAYVDGIPSTSLYPGIEDMLRELNQRAVPWAIVTNIPSQFAKKVATHHRLQPTTAVYYHDVRKPKPAPDMVFLAMQRLDATPQVSLGVGDTSTDADAFAAAGVGSFCAAWNPNAEQGAAWTALLTMPGDLRQYL